MTDVFQGNFCLTWNNNEVEMKRVYKTNGTKREKSRKKVVSFCDRICNQTVKHLLFVFVWEVMKPLGDFIHPWVFHLNLWSTLSHSLFQSNPENPFDLVPFRSSFYILLSSLFAKKMFTHWQNTFIKINGIL